MLHFSSWDTFLCSSWLCALQAAILEEPGDRQEEQDKVNFISDKNIFNSLSHVLVRFLQTVST